MEGNITDSAKINVAKQVMTEMIENLPEKVNIGLMVFGNGIKGSDCIRLVVPLGKLDKSRLTEAIKSFRPAGITPIAESLNTAGDYLVRNNLGATIIMVTDGKQEAPGNADPVEAVAKLREMGLEVKIHIIGLAVGNPEKQQLEKVAEIGGGDFYSVSTPQQLKEALAETMTAANEETRSIVLLSAQVKTEKFSNVLHSLKTNETLRLAFNPVQLLDPDNPAEHRIVFSGDDWRLELLRLPNDEWQLRQVLNNETTELPWPEGLKVIRNNVNSFKIIRTKKMTFVFINDKYVRNLFVEKESVEFKVGVDGWKVELTDLTIVKPMK